MTDLERHLAMKNATLIGELRSELDYPEAQDRAIRAKLIAVEEYYRAMRGK